MIGALFGAKTKILLILLVIASLSLAAAGWVIKQQIEKIALLEDRYEEQREETEKANAEIDRISTEHQSQIADIRAFMEDQRDTISDLREREASLRSTQDSLTRAIQEEPVRAGRVTTILDARSLRDICRASGGSEDECRIALPQSPDAGGGYTPPD